MANGKDTNYDRIAGTYLATTNEKPILKHYERPFILSRLPALKGKQVLDMGCASGYYSRYCLDKGARVISVDASAKMVEHTNAVCVYQNSGHVHDIALPFSFVPSDSVDVIICSLVLHYVKDWDPVLAECHRMLVKGGICVISTHHPVNDFNFFNQQDYFATRMITEEWRGFREPIKVRYFIRPLSEYIGPMLRSHLRLVSVDEPIPGEMLQKVDEKVYDRLMTRPTFLFFTLEKES